MLAAGDSATTTAMVVAMAAMAAMAAVAAVAGATGKVTMEVRAEATSPIRMTRPRWGQRCG